jgi:hypothetical protein
MPCRAPCRVGNGRSTTRSTRRGMRFIPRTPSRRPAVCPPAPLDDLITFHTVFGKTVPDVSLNAVANLGYAEGRFHQPVYPGDTLRSRSEVIGLKQNSNGKSGVVYVRTEGLNQHGTVVLDYVRWVMVRKRDPGCARARDT